MKNLYVFCGCHRNFAVLSLELPLVLTGTFFQGSNGYFSSAQGGNLFRSKEGTIPEIFRKFPEFSAEIDRNRNILILYRTGGVIFFIDYCTAIRDT